MLTLFVKMWNFFYLKLDAENFYYGMKMPTALCFLYWELQFWYPTALTFLSIDS